ncbi:protein-L-isoaspartate O-methyltransferase [Allorhizobium sp. BGMRC 0089]|uniref:protein-L-isoaspartate O-methyltransferase family protein n=1 Tax=Allorhizobium sonneratiae TaxID=2934936 RepID=UPI0020338013|nr:protein-L-isoaspartate O-methyltransferase [Allorhizobium sonneratiae]MCM2292930.1 protein-L-isoaspartate O-methyltransferase [Allorhizobium sonneratiae]
MIDFEQARVKMVDGQIRTTDVTYHSIIAAFLDIPREIFVPDSLKAVAYIDEDLPIAPGRYLMDPSPLGKLLQLAEIRSSDLALEIGAGTGYVSALLGRLAGGVVAVESDPDLATKARENLAKLGQDNVKVVDAPLEQGYQSDAPYDLIFINGAVEEIPAPLFQQLREGGRLIAVVGEGHSARATLFVKAAGTISSTAFFNATIKPLPGFSKAREFVF